MGIVATMIRKLYGRSSWKCLAHRSALILCLLSGAGACSMHQQYPTEWAPLVPPSKGCLDISGIYIDTVNPHKIPSLSNILIKKWVGAGKLDKASHVEIMKGGDNALTATAWNDSVAIASKTYKSGQYICTDRGIEINMGVDTTAQNVVGVSWGKVTLAKAGDGSLVVISEGGGAGLGFLIIPIVGSDLQYFRYPVKKEERQDRKESITNMNEEG